MSSTPTTTPNVQASASSSSSTATGSAAPATASASSTKQYQVGNIPAFKPNYAAAASKSKPSPAAINGKVDVTATITPPSAPGPTPSVPSPAPMSGPASTSSGHSRKESVKVEGVQVPPSRVSAIRGAADSNVAFGNVSDKNAVLSSSPANPPAMNGNGKPQAFGTVPTATKAPINLHQFFGVGAPPSSAAGPGPPRPAFAQSSSPSSSLPPNPNSQLSSASQSFAPRQSMPPSFIPQQQPGFPSPQPQYSPYPNPGSSPYQQHAKPPAQNIPNGSPYGGPGGPSGGANGGAPGGPQRNSSYGSPVMQHRGSIPGGAPRGQFGGPTSPRQSNAGLPQQGMMYQQQQWQPQPFPGYAPQGYYPGPPMPPQGYPLPPPGQYAPGVSGPGAVPSLTSGASTPSAGVRTPSISGAPGVPPSPSPSPLSMNPSAAFVPGQPYSPQPQSATLPHHPHPYSGHAPHASVGGTPLRASGSSFSLSSAASASDFKPEAAVFTPRKSQAIKIRNPNDPGVVVPSPAKKAPTTPAPSTPTLAAAKTEDEKKKDADTDAAAKKASEDAAAALLQKKADEETAEKAAVEAKATEERIAKEKTDADALAEKERLAAVELKASADAQAAKDKAAADEKKAASDKLAADEAAAAKVAADKAAADKRVEELKSAASSAPSTPGVEVAGLKVRSVEADAVRQEEETLLADERAATAAATLVEARDALPSSSDLPSNLPDKPVNGAATAPPASDSKLAKHVPEALDLTATKEADVAPALPSALLTARPISNLEQVAYPANIKSPRSDLNATAEPGKYRYDREFLMQFMSVCVEKPEQLPNLEAIGMVDAGADPSGGRAGGGNFPGGGNRRPSSMGPPALPNNRSSTGPASAGGFGRMGSGAVGGGFAMGNFSTTPGTGGVGSSQSRFEASNNRSASAGGAFAGPPGGARSGMTRTASQGGVGGPQGFQPARTRSERGAPRQGGGRDGGGRDGGGGGRGGGGKHTTGDGFEGATLDNHVEDRWMPSVLGANATDATAPDSPELVQRKVKALLNKLTLEKFDSISDQILAWADKSVNETDGRILRQVIALIFEKATDEANFSEMYARLCRKLMEKVSPNVKDEGVKGPDGALVAGGGLFRKYLLNRCQEDYESGWKAKEVSAAAAADKAGDDNAKKEANDAAEKEAKEGTAPSKSSAPKEAELLSDEYYAAEKAKRRGLGLVRFIGELYRLQMLTERIMHECIKKLLANTENPEEEDVESLCRLLTTVGKGLDNVKAKAHMDIYFSRMKLIADNMKISSRIRFMIQDVLELRLDRWQPRNLTTGPKLLSEIHSDAQKAAEDSARRTASSGGKGMPRLQDQLSRPNSRRGQGRDQFGVPAVGPDGWSAPVPQRPAKAGDLSGFGKIREPATAISLGPSGAFANRAAKAKEASRPAPGNMFSLLEAQGAEASTSSRPKLVLAPRTVPKDGEAEEGDEKAEEETPEAEAEDEDDGAIDPNAVSMSRAEGERKAGNSVKEFFAVKSISEGIASVEALPVEYRSFLISSLANAAIEKKADEVNITRQLFAEAVVKNVVTHAQMLAAMAVPLKTLIDVSVDAPSAYTFAAQLLAGAGVSREETEELSKKMETEEDDEEEVVRGQGLLLAAVDKILAA
ncbi:hypothetical protein RQP46_001563 [Phenoliferia psychrophenolica]